MTEEEDREVAFLVELFELALDRTVPPPHRNRVTAQALAKIQSKRAKSTSSLAFKPENK